MPYAGVFPVAQFFTSPLAVDLTVAGGSVYKCIYGKSNITDEFNSENYEITALVQIATAAAIADNSEVAIAGVTYEITHRIEEEPGMVRLFLSKADHEITDPTLGAELFDTTNFTGVNWEVLNNATLATNLATLNAFEDDPAQIQYGTVIALEQGERYRFRVVVFELYSGVLIITDQGSANFTEYIDTDGTHDFYFEANKTDTRNIVFTALNNEEEINLTSVSLKKVTG